MKNIPGLPTGTCNLIRWCLSLSLTILVGPPENNVITCSPMPLAFTMYKFYDSQNYQPPKKRHQTISNLKYPQTTWNNHSQLRFGKPPLTPGPVLRACCPRELHPHRAGPNQVGRWAANTWDAVIRLWLPSGNRIFSGNLPRLWKMDHLQMNQSFSIVCLVYQTVYTYII